jgi:hypothetical protein
VQSHHRLRATTQASSPACAAPTTQRQNLSRGPVWELAVRGSDGWRPLHTQRPPRPTRCPTHGPHASPGSESGAGSHPRNLGAPTPRPPVTRIVYLHRASAPPLASASLSHWTIGHGIRNPPQRASACTVRVLSGTSAPALSYAGRRASYTLQQAIEAACPVEGRRVVPGCPAPACGGALCTCMAHCHVCAYMVHS